MTKIVKAPEVDVVKMAEYRRQADDLLAFLTTAPCETPEQESFFSSTLGSVRGLIKSLEDERQSVTKPMLEAKRRVDQLFAPATKPLQECETVIRARLTAAAANRFAAEAEARRLAADLAAEGKHAEVLDALANVTSAPETEGSSAKVAWVAVVEDFAALSDEYKLVNEGALAAVAKASVTSTPPPTIPGVRWEMTAKVRARP